MIDSSNGLYPQRLLLATDLCARCDRPLDRAKQLALEWQSALAILTVREGPRTPDEVSSWLDGAPAPFERAAHRELDEEFRDSGLAPTLQVAQGDVTDAILAAAEAMPDALVVTGPSDEDSLQELILGTTAERLSQELAQPLLVVRQRSRGPYARILVANDFSNNARHALETATRLFPGRRIVLFHVLEALSEPVAGAVQDALQASDRFLDDCRLAPGAREHITTFIGHGSVSDTIASYALEQSIQLAVLGVQRQSAQSQLARIFTASRRGADLLQQLACDTLLVPAREGHEDG